MRNAKPPSRPSRVTGTALILVKNSVVEEAFRETGIRLANMNALGPRLITKAYRDGWLAGERVNLNRPVSGTGQDLLG